MRRVELDPVQEGVAPGPLSQGVQAGDLSTVDRFNSQSAASGISDSFNIVPPGSTSISAVNRTVFYLIAILLLSTALAKVWMLLTDSFAEVRVSISKEVLWLSVAIELWLAFENVRVRNPQVLAFINTVVFAVFGIFATIRWGLGYGSCGCSGQLDFGSRDLRQGRNLESNRPVRQDHRNGAILPVL